MAKKTPYRKPLLRQQAIQVATCGRRLDPTGELNLICLLPPKHPGNVCASVAYTDENGIVGVTSQDGELRICQLENDEPGE
jgi:hypothetical protein